MEFLLLCFITIPSAGGIDGPILKPTKEFASPLDLGISVTRSCSEAVNLVVMNAPETVLYENEIPERMRKDKYQIGYWVSFVALF